MFTGLIQTIGSITRLKHQALEATLSVKTSLNQLKLGESIAVNGVCLSVTQINPEGFIAFTSKETLLKTGLGDLSSGSKVNLERALRLGDPIGGHLVAGHVDAQVKLLDRVKIGEAEQWTVALPSKKDVSQQIAPKGSVTLDGVSLTINKVRETDFTLMVIPLTLQETTLNKMPPGTNINIETDLLAKYVARQLAPVHGNDGAINMEFLMHNGFSR